MKRNVNRRAGRTSVARSLRNFPPPTPLESPCRNWQGALTGQGYGRLWVAETQRLDLVHGWVVASVVGWEAIKGKVVMHRCDNRLCFRFDHLMIGTKKDNSLDMASKGRWSNGYRAGTVELLTHCKNGHEFTPDNTYVRKDNGVRQCRRCHADSENKRRA